VYDLVSVCLCFVMWIACQIMGIMWLSGWGVHVNVFLSYCKNKNDTNKFRSGLRTLTSLRRDFVLQKKKLLLRNISFKSRNIMKI
jgi:hypothetical protein